jgi:phosphatidylserine/phosphatidylglycerophosphate/cardiolipin synthase-like enzyme
MDNEYIKIILQKVLDGKRLTHSRREELDQLIGYCKGNPRKLADIREFVFQIAAAKMAVSPGSAVLTRVEEVSRIIDQALVESFPTLARVHFNPGEECLQGILKLLKNTRHSVDICVFTITDDSITEAIYRAHKRGKKIRIITDDEKIHAPGSDIIPMATAGIPVAIDHAIEYMHHKFAIFDCHILLSGSFNWTRSASMGNHENLLVTDDPRLVKPFCGEFERLWKEFPMLQLEEKSFGSQA